MLDQSEVVAMVYMTLRVNIKDTLNWLRLCFSLLLRAQISPRDGSFVCTTPSIRIKVLSSNNFWIRSFSCLLCVSYSNSFPETSVVSLWLILHKKNSNLVFLITRRGHPLAAQSRGTRDLSERSRISRNKDFAMLMTQAIKKKLHQYHQELTVPRILGLFSQLRRSQNRS
jgi:hypothetical protein